MMGKEKANRRLEAVILCGLKKASAADSLIRCLRPRQRR